MAKRIACALASVLAPLLIFAPLDRYLPYGSLAAGAIVCTIACVLGFELAFVVYAMASWVLAALLLAPAHRLDSETARSFADATYMSAVLAAAAGFVRAIVTKRGLLRRRARTPRRDVPRSTTP